jgi:hypothetical protein
MLKIHELPEFASSETRTAPVVGASGKPISCRVMRCPTSGRRDAGRARHALDVGGFRMDMDVGDMRLAERASTIAAEYGPHRAHCHRRLETTSLNSKRAWRATISF